MDSTLVIFSALSVIVSFIQAEIKNIPKRKLAINRLFFIFIYFYLKNDNFFCQIIIFLPFKTRTSLISINPNVNLNLVHPFLILFVEFGFPWSVNNKNNLTGLFQLG
ncbi:MAG: hypothetical protein EA362_03615 [Saprospirales bacterium]|nr:MAG: hypothetical protein EA362_03615 [Saprospirales bacterium]